MVKNAIWILIAVLSLIAVGMFVEKSYDVFSIQGCPAGYSTSCERYLEARLAWLGGTCPLSYFQSEANFYHNNYPEDYLRLDVNTWTCSGGPSIEGDTNNDGSISFQELVSYASLWINNQKTFAQLMTVGAAWAG